MTTALARRCATLAVIVLAVTTPSLVSVRAAAAPPAVPATELGSPALAAVQTGRLDLLYRSADRGLSHQYLAAGGSWSRPVARGGVLYSQPAAVSWGPGRLDVFMRASDAAIWHRALSGGVWSAWQSLGGSWTSAPAAASWGAGRLDVFARGQDSALWQRTYSGGWSSWKRVGGRLTASPSATSSVPGRIDVVVRSTDSAAYHKAWTGSAWTGWVRISGPLSGRPVVAAPAAGALDVAVLGSNQRMYLKRRSASGVWGSWSSIGTTTFTSGPGILAVGGSVRIVAQRSNGFYYEVTRSSPTAAWSSWRSIDAYLPFRGLATWVDVLDYGTLVPATAVADMKARGVRTLFLSTARFNSANDFYDAVEMAQWLEAAHAAGIRVVGWYVPAYGDLNRDVRRTVAIGNYVSPGGQRFDAVGVDIERFGESGELTRSGFNAQVVPHLQQVRAGTDAVVGAIVPSPYATDPGNNWTGFPWSGIGPNSEVVVPMALWSFRSGFSAAQVYAWVKDQVDRTQALTGRRVHVEGGVAGEGSTVVDPTRMTQFVRAATDAGAIGGSNYDYRTTSPAWWSILGALNP